MDGREIVPAAVQHSGGVGIRITDDAEREPAKGVFGGDAD